VSKRCCSSPILSAREILKRNDRRTSVVYFCDTCKTQFFERVKIPSPPHPEALPGKEEAAENPVIGDEWQWKCKKISVIAVTKKSITWRKDNKKDKGAWVVEGRNIFKNRALQTYSSLLKRGPEVILKYKPSKQVRLEKKSWITCQCGKRGFSSKKQVRNSTQKLNHNYRIYRCELSYTWHITKN